MLFKIKVFPGSRKEKIVKTAKDELRIYTKKRAEHGKANKRVFEMLSQYFKFSKIKLVKGGKRSNKIFEIKKITERIMVM